MRWVRGFCSHIHRPVNSFFSLLYSGFLYMFMNVYRCTSMWGLCVCMFVCACGWVGVLVCVAHLRVCMCIRWEMGELVWVGVCARVCVQRCFSPAAGW